jgi:hypothetical protein
VTSAAAGATSAAHAATREAEEGAGGVTAGVEEAAGQATASAGNGLLGAPAGRGANQAQGRSEQAPTRAAASSAERDPEGIRPPGIDSAPAGATNPTALPARLWHPFIRVWPAIALTLEHALAEFDRRGSRSLLVALLGAIGGGSLRGQGAALTGAAPAASHASAQPPFSWFSPPSLSPYDWVGEKAALPVLVFFLILAAGALAILLAMRRELGEPLLPQRLRHWWR